MPINIKNERVTELATRLAAQTGETITDAVGHAIEEKLERIDAERQKKERSVKLRALVNEFHRDASPEWLAMTQKEFDDELYDEMGLPR